MPRPARRSVPARVVLSFCVVGALGLTGCTSLLSETAATTAGVGGSALAGSVTRNATVASGIGLGVLAASQAGVKALERDYHDDQQERIARVAGALKVGQVARWESRHRVPVESDAEGRVTVSRLIGGANLRCKEIVFTVDPRGDQGAEKDADKDDQEGPVNAFYVATICKDADKWRWATAEPATARWGSLQ